MWFSAIPAGSREVTVSFNFITERSVYKTTTITTTTTTTTSSSSSSGGGGSSSSSNGNSNSSNLTRKKLHTFLKC
jgi:hypothetical protein